MAEPVISNPPIVRAHLGLGANLGDAASTIAVAVDAIAHLPRTRLARCSSLYRTSPVGYTAQPDFLNAVIAIDTSLDPQVLVETLKQLETRLGRIARPQWHEREIDIDVLSYDVIAYAWGDVRIPHPRAHERRFVLEPFAEIAPETVLAGHDFDVRTLLARCGDEATVVKLGAVPTTAAGGAR